MPVIREIVEHVLFHVNAEAASSDDSQASGVSTRAQFVRDAVASLIADNRNISRGRILQELRALAPGGPSRNSFRRTLAHSISVDDDNLQLTIQAWVGQNVERRDNG